MRRGRVRDRDRERERERERERDRERGFLRGEKRSKTCSLKIGFLTCKWRATC